MKVIFLQCNSGIVMGIDGKLVKVETYIGNGLPSFSVIGLPDAIVRESKERIRAALKSCGISLPPRRIVVNLSPADLKKSGSHFDLPIAYNLLNLILEGKKSFSKENIALIGELSLNGKIVGIKGVLSLVEAFKRNGIEKVFVPFENYFEAALIEGIEIIALKDLGELLKYMNGEEISFKENSMQLEASLEYDECDECCLDYKDVIGQEFPKRALTIAIAGNHNILMVGSPGVGKSMIAKRIPGIMNKLSYEEAIEVAKIFSLVDENGAEVIKSRRRPFRSPHHSITKAALIGGGGKLTPGEISLSHNGILFLDEILEFDKDSIDFLREPLEEKSINITRISGNINYPANFMLVAAMNPCKCGYYGSSNKKCICKESQVKSYLRKMSGPILDRISILVKMNEIDIKVAKCKEGKSTSEMAYIINNAKNIQRKRYEGTAIKNNNDLNENDIKKYCNISAKALNALEDGYKKFELSLRSYNNMIKVSRTIADIDGSDEILENHVFEALQFRKLERYIMG